MITFSGPMRFLLLAVWLLFGAGGSPCLAQEKKAPLPDERYRVVYDFSHDWQYYAPEMGTYLPLDRERSYQYAAAHLPIDYSAYQDKLLLFRARPGLALFVNHKLSALYQKERWVAISLRQMKAEVSDGQLMVTFFSRANPLPLQQVYAAERIEQDQASAPTMASSEGIDLRNREAEGPGTPLFLVMLGLSALFVVVKNVQSHGLWRGMVGLFRPSTEEVLTEYSTEFWGRLLFFTPLNALLVAGSMHIGFQLNPEWKNLDPSITWLGWGLWEGTFFRYLLLALGFQLVFYAFVRLAASLFNLGQLAQVHYLELNRFTTFFGLWSLVWGLLLANWPQWGSQYFLVAMLVGLVASFALRILKMSLLLLARSGYKNLYLISYICTTEFIPLLVVVKLVI